VCRFDFDEGYRLPIGLPNPEAGKRGLTQPFAAFAEKALQSLTLRLTYQQNQFSYESRIENKRKRPNLLHRNRLQAKSEVKKKVGRGLFAGGGFIRSKTGLSLLLGG